jgi:serine/threonine-protein kinase
VSHGGDDSVGRVILGRYRVVLPLGRGGQGTVYLARGEGAAGFARPVVVKRILAPFARDPEMLEQFAREARITSQLRHPSIVSVIDFARDRDSYVMVLEYVHGYDLRRWERYVRKVREHFSPELVIFPLLRVLDALHYAHTLRAPDGSPRRIIHRDISPANVLLDVEGHVKLTDFGIARMADEEMTQDTSTVKIKGKLPYLAPEMFAGVPPSERTDMYACGVVLHELLVGRNEFHAGSAVESMARVTGHVPTRLDAVRKDISKQLADITEKALLKEPRQRFQTATEFAAALREVLDVDEMELSERFRRVVFEDFNDPRMAQITSSRTLTMLDSAWRDRHDAPSLAEQARAHARTAEDTGALLHAEQVEIRDARDETRALPGAETLTQQPERGPRALAIATVLVALIGGIAAIYVSRNAPQSAPKFVYVDKQPVPAQEPVPAASQAERAAPDEAAASDAAAVLEGPALTATAAAPSLKAAKESQGERLTRMFAKHRGAVERCFEEHGHEAERSGPLQVQFSIDLQGRVRSASIVPDALTRTTFGRCVTRVAAATRFGKQSSALVFRIPITARKVTLRGGAP